MSRFPLVAEDAVQNPEVAAVYDEIRQELGFGMVPNMFKSMAIRPTLLRTEWNKFRATVLQGHLPRTLKEMMGVLISDHHGSEYAKLVHMHGLSAMGTSDAVLGSLITDFAHCPLPERDKAILRFGLTAGTAPLQLTDADWQTLRDHDLSDEEIFEVIATANLFAGVNVYTDSAAVPVDQL